MLGKLKEIDNLRAVWKNEAQDFTQWLSKKENMRLLSQEIGLDLLTQETEANVGQFNVDLLAEEDGGERIAIIENQLEDSDHDHLGKVLTYASGLEADILIWIVKRAREEHRKAIEWLNEKTDEDINAFLIELELWQIEDSKPAVKFNVVTQPNNWVKIIKRHRQSDLTDMKKKQLQFWNEFRDYCLDHNVKFSLRTPRPQHWYTVAIGTSEAHISLNLNSFDDEIRCELYISDNKDLFDSLDISKEEIETKLGAGLEWMRLPEKKASVIRIKRDGNIDNEQQWDEYFSWFIKYVHSFREVFPDYLKS